VFTLILSLVARKSESIQMGIFFTCMCLAFGAERLNTYARNNWKMFSTQAGGSPY
jgi:hypothetical protein